MDYVKVQSRFGHKKYQRQREAPVKSVSESVDTAKPKAFFDKGNAPGITKATPNMAGPKITKTPKPSGAKLGNRH